MNAEGEWCLRQEERMVPLPRAEINESGSSVYVFAERSEPRNPPKDLLRFVAKLELVTSPPHDGAGNPNFGRLRRLLLPKYVILRRNVEKWRFCDPNDVFWWQKAPHGGGALLPRWGGHYRGKKSATKHAKNHVFGFIIPAPSWGGGNKFPPWLCNLESHLCLSTNTVWEEWIYILRLIYGIHSWYSQF